MSKEIIDKINNNLIMLVEGFDDAERDYGYDLANEKHYVSELIDLVKNLSLFGVVGMCCDETRKVNQFLKRPSKYCMTCSKELKKQFSLQGVVASVLCINVPKTWDITEGKKYRIIKEEEHHFKIINDYGKLDSYHKDWLKKL